MKILLHKFLKSCGYSKAIKDFEEFYQSHPDYPSLFSITDSLSANGIENLAARIPQDRLRELPDVFLASLHDGFHLVQRTGESYKCETEQGEKKFLSAHEFGNRWDGLVLAIENNAEIAPPKKNYSAWAKYAAPLLLLCSLCLGFQKTDAFPVGIFVLAAFGLVLGILVIRQNSGLESAIVDGLCNAGSNASCSEVIKSDNTNFPKWIPFVDLPLVYFAACFMATAIEPSAAVVFGWLSALSIPVLMYSLWIQNYRLKKWCVLCLCVSATLLAQTALFAASGNARLPEFGIGLFSAAFCLSLTGFGWYLLKPGFAKLSELRESEQSLLKFKRNFELFRHLSAQLNYPEALAGMNGILLGNLDAPNKLYIFVSPSCGFCHKAIADALELTQRFGNRISARIVFNVNPENPDNPYLNIIQSLLVLNTQNPASAIQALKDWHIERLDIQQWTSKWGKPMPDPNAQAQMKLQHDWCRSEDIVYTPAKILNGAMYPKEYEIDEVRYFFSELEQERPATLQAV